MTRHFEKELDTLRTTLIRMASLVDEQIENAVKALLQSDRELAQTVIQSDGKVDEFDNEIDRQCMRIFALSQPVAIDLRLLMAALKINSELERIGDIAVNLAERVEPLLSYKGFVNSAGMEKMVLLARKMVRDAIDSFINSDEQLAQKILEADDQIDDYDATIFGNMLKTMVKDPANVEPGAHTMMLSRHVERLADHATNIAEDVIFLINAKIIKHHAENQAQ